MNSTKEKILVWLPSPMGDAILSVPALRSIREHFSQANITFLATKVVRDVLQPCSYCDGFINLRKNPLKLASIVKSRQFDKAILLKNSLGSALTVFLAGVKHRIGYDRDWRGIFLSERIKPAMEGVGKFKPGSMVDYYLKLCKKLGCDVSDGSIKLEVSRDDLASVADKLDELMDSSKPLAILVPGGAFGPSKLWPTERFAALADKIIEKYDANAVVSVAPNKAEIKIAEKICRQASHELFDLGRFRLGPGELKGLFSKADIVVTNDTGGRHIAIALRKKVVTLFGPNNPEWTQTGYEDEMQIRGRAECVPCDKPKCKMNRHICMESISVDEVFAAVEKMLDSQGS